MLWSSWIWTIAAARPLYSQAQAHCTSVELQETKAGWNPKEEPFSPVTIMDLFSGSCSLHGLCPLAYIHSYEFYADHFFAFLLIFPIPNQLGKLFSNSHESIHTHISCHLSFYTKWRNQVFCSRLCPPGRIFPPFIFMNTPGWVCGVTAIILKVSSI